MDSTPVETAGTSLRHPIPSRWSRSALLSASDPPPKRVTVQASESKLQGRWGARRAAESHHQATTPNAPDRTRPTSRPATQRRTRSERAGPGVPVGPSKQTLSTPGLGLLPSLSLLPPSYNRHLPTSTAPPSSNPNHREFNQRTPRPQQPPQSPNAAFDFASSLEGVSAASALARRDSPKSFVRSFGRRWIGTRGWRSRGRTRRPSAPTRSASPRRVGLATTSPTRSRCSRFAPPCSRFLPSVRAI